MRLHVDGQCGRLHEEVAFGVGTRKSCCGAERNKRSIHAGSDPIYVVRSLPDGCTEMNAASLAGSAGSNEAAARPGFLTGPALICLSKCSDSSSLGRLPDRRSHRSFSPCWPVTPRLVLTWLERKPAHPERPALRDPHNTAVSQPTWDSNFRAWHNGIREVILGQVLSSPGRDDAK